VRRTGLQLLRNKRTSVVAASPVEIVSRGRKHYHDVSWIAYRAERSDETIRSFIHTFYFWEIREGVAPGYLFEAVPGALDFLVDGAVEFMGEASPGWPQQEMVDVRKLIYYPVSYLSL
jgi:hypothetical protein